MDQGDEEALTDCEATASVFWGEMVETNIGIATKKLDTSLGSEPRSAQLVQENNPAM
jgi:hypothetical protein